MTAPQGIQSISVLGVRVDDVTYAETVEWCCRFIKEGGPHLIATVNPEFVMTAQGEPAFQAVLSDAALSLPDGVGLLLAARLHGLRLREQVRGTDLVYHLADVCERLGYRMFLLGAAPGVAEEAAAVLKSLHPSLQIAGTYSGSPQPEGDAEARAAIEAGKPVHVLLVAYGAPKQEMWLARNQAALGVPVAIGVGGVFDYLSGRVPRAPRWLREAGFEWLYRLIRQPWRWRRQLRLMRFAWRVIAGWLLRNGAVSPLRTGRPCAQRDGH